jgi:hypothetical protein
MGKSREKEERAAKRTLREAGRAFLSALPVFLLVFLLAFWSALVLPGWGRIASAVLGTSTLLSLVWSLSGAPTGTKLKGALRTFLKWRWINKTCIVIGVVFLVLSGFFTSERVVSSEPHRNPIIAVLVDTSIAADSTTRIDHRIPLDADRPSAWSIKVTEPAGRMVAYRSSDSPWVYRRRLRPWFPTVIHHPADFGPPIVATALVAPRMSFVHPGTLRVHAYMPAYADEPVAQDTVTARTMALMLSHVRPERNSAKDLPRWLAVAARDTFSDADRHLRLVARWDSNRVWLRSSRELRDGTRVVFILFSPAGDTAGKLDFTVSRDSNNARIIRPRPR